MTDADAASGGKTKKPKRAPDPAVGRRNVLISIVLSMAVPLTRPLIDPAGFAVDIVVYGFAMTLTLMAILCWFTWIGQPWARFILGSVAAAFFFICVGLLFAYLFIGPSTPEASLDKVVGAVVFGAINGWITKVLLLSHDTRAWAEARRRR